jgi:hypothetical protein
MQERQRRKCARKAAKEVYKKGSTGNVQKRQHNDYAIKAAQKKDQKNNTLSTTAQEVCKKGS